MFHRVEGSCMCLCVYACMCVYVCFRLICTSWNTTPIHLIHFLHHDSWKSSQWGAKLWHEESRSLLRYKEAGDVV